MKELRCKELAKKWLIDIELSTSDVFISLLHDMMGKCSVNKNDDKSFFRFYLVALDDVFYTSRFNNTNHFLENDSI